ncbi:hypothetical protein ACOMHN_040826 [Nucella lapillus]
MSTWADHVTSTEPERPHARTRRSSPRRPTKPSLRIGVKTRRRGQRRRTRNKNKRRGRIGGKRSGRMIDAKVELLVVVENSIYRKFLADNQNNRQAALARIRRYYGIMVAMVDERFQTIEDRRLTVSVRISGIMVAEFSGAFPRGLTSPHLGHFVCLVIMLPGVVVVVTG